MVLNAIRFISTFGFLVLFPSAGHATGIIDINSIFHDNSMKIAGRAGTINMKNVCGENPILTANTVTHYFMPVLDSFDSRHCHWVEGVCQFKYKGVDYMYDFTGTKENPRPDPDPSRAVPKELANCKSGKGYSRDWNCTQPCRSLATDPRFHRPGEIIFFKDLVGMKCGTGKNAMTHDGFMVVNDTGARRHFNREGRFDFYWGQCDNFSPGRCHDGGEAISNRLSHSLFCRAWTPLDPLKNTDLKISFVNQVRYEAIERGDNRNAAGFDIDALVVDTEAIIEQFRPTPVEVASAESKKKFVKRAKKVKEKKQKVASRR